MKKLRLLFSVLTLLAVCTFITNANAQCSNLYIAGVVDGPLTGGTPKAIQLCASGAITDLSTYGIESITNGGGSGGAEEFTLPADPLGAGECVWITSDLAQFNAYFGFDACYESGTVNVNGDDAFILYCSGVAEDAFGDPNTDGTGEPWEYLDGWAVSNDMAANPTFTSTEWTYSGPNALDGEMTNAGAANPYPNAVANCPAMVFDCPAEMVNFGDACDDMTANTINDVIQMDCTCTGTLVDCPVLMSNIGDACDDNDVTTINDVIQADCTCAGTPTGLLDCGGVAWEAVQVVNNSELDVWIPVAGGWSISGFAGTGNMEQVDQWLVYGPIDVSSTSSLFLNFDAVKNFSGITDLNILWTDSYPGCPADATWTNAATITENDEGAVSTDLSAAAGTAVFIAIEYSDDGADGYAEWILTNFALLADVCPAVGLPMTSACTTTCSISNVAIAGSCTGADYVYSVSFSVVGGSGSYDVIDVTSGSVLANGGASPISITIAGNTSTTPFDVNVMDNANTTCMGTAATVTPIDCSIPIVCPAAFINEFHYDNGGSDVNEFVEIAVPVGGDVTQLTITLYASTGSMYNSINLTTAEFVSSDGTYDYYAWYPASIQNGGSDGLALSCADGSVLQLLSYEGTLTATDGPATGQMSTDVGVAEDGTTTGTQSIMFDGTGWVTMCVADAGFANDTSTCGAVSGCTDMNACNYDPAATEDDGSCFSVGDTCDDGDAATTGDVYVDCTTCAGTCPGGSVPGNACDDGNAMTMNDTVQPDCTCAGTFPPAGECDNLYIAGIIDGPLAGGTPKGLQLCASADISDLSAFGIETVANGGGSSGIEDLTFPADAIAAGDCIWVTSDLAQFNAYFGFNACYESGTIGGAINVNGDDAVILYCEGNATDVFGDPNTDGTGQIWEYMDGWAVSNDMTANPTFNDTEWTYSGPNALDNETSNDTATSPYPNATANCPAGTVAGCTDMNACNYDPDASTDDGSCFSIGDTCDDGDATTENDAYTDCMTCAGTPIGCPGGAVPGDPCDDMDATTENDVVQADCSCVGVVPTACPASAKINEFHYDNLGTDVNEFIEIALPAGSDPSGVVVSLYNGNGGTEYGTYTLTAADLVSSDGTNDYYVWNIAMQNGNDGIAVSCGGTVFQFITYEGAFDATEGPAAGMTGVDVGVSEANDAAETSSIMCDGAGTYLGNCVQDPGMANNTTTCVPDPIPGCTDMAACNYDPTATEDDGSCFNIGDTCDDGDATTTNDVYTDCMTCAGTLPEMGCTDATACNYNSVATQDDGSCIYASGCDVCDGAGGVTDNPEVGEACDDGDAATVNDTVQMDCSCAGIAPTCPATAKINEFHYDNAGTDVNEFVEIALPAGSDPIGVVISLYNGNGGVEYGSYTLTAADLVSSDGTNDYYVWNVSMQNGADGIAVSCGGTVFEFITYEGAFDATDGPAAGMTGVDVGVDEATDAAETSSIMCDGAGAYLTNCTQDPGAANDTSTCMMDAPSCTLAAGSCAACPAGNDNIAIDLATGTVFNDAAEFGVDFAMGFTPITPSDYDATTNTGTWTLPTGVANAFAAGGVSGLTLPNIVNGGCLTADINVISGTTPFLIEFRIENGTGAPGNGGQALTFDVMVDGTGMCSMGGDFSAGTAANGFTFTPGTPYGVVVAVVDFSNNPVPTDIVVEISNIALNVCAPDVPGCIDVNACNFDPAATTDDGSCIFATGCDVCDGMGGITDNPEAGETCDDGDDATINDTVQADCSCAGEIPDSGCTDPNATNYDSTAGVDDGSCLYLCDDANLLDVSTNGGFDGGSGLSYGSPGNMGLFAGANDDFGGFIWNVNTTGLTNDDFCISIDYTVTGDAAAFPITLEFRIENGNCGFFPCPWIDFNTVITGPGTYTFGGIVSSGNAGANGPFDPAGANTAIVAAIANFSGTPLGADINVDFSNLCVSTDCAVEPPADCAPGIIQFPANPTGN